MKVFVKHEGNDDLVYANIQMHKSVFVALREFMHCQNLDPDIVTFPYGATLVRQGYGWYRLVVYKTHRGNEKIQTALKILRVFWRQFQQHMTAEISRLLRQALDPSYKVVAAVDAGASRPTIMTVSTPAPRKNERSNMQQLLERFGPKPQPRRGGMLAAISAPYGQRNTV